MEREFPLLDGTLPDAEVKRIAHAQGDCCKVCGWSFDGAVQTPSGTYPLTMHAAQYVFTEPHKHVDVVVCCACYAILTGQELPLTDTNKTPLVFLKGQP